jgi:threonyl-tRNA synthetase
LWLSPAQIKIIPISEKFAPYAKKLFDALMDAEVRVKLDDRNETLGSRIRDAQKEKIPYTLVVGAKEEESKSVAVRPRVGNQEVMPFDKFLEKALKEIKDKA